jgi:hypothetical protein
MMSFLHVNEWIEMAFLVFMSNKMAKIQYSDHAVSKKKQEVQVRKINVTPDIPEVGLGA